MMSMISRCAYISLILFVITISAGCVLTPQGPPPEAIIITFSADTRAEIYKCG